MSSQTTKWIIFLVSIGVATGLRSMRVFVPQAIKKGGTAIFTCDFDPEGDQIYSVKWYKGNYEFFRYSPKEENQIKIFPMKGLHIDKSKTNMTRLTLFDVGMNLTGKYNCEVSVESSFHTELLSGDMEVVEVPSHPPVITGVKPKYRLGETLTANCTSGRSLPVTNLTWYINNEMAGLQQVEHFALPKEAGMMRSQSRISFIVKSHDFLYHELKLRCSANIHSIYMEKTEKIIEEDRLGDPTRVDIVLPANFLDGDDDDSRKNRRYMLNPSSCSTQVKITRLLASTLPLILPFIVR